MRQRFRRLRCSDTGTGIGFEAVIPREVSVKSAPCREHPGKASAGKPIPVQLGREAPDIMYLQLIERQALCKFYQHSNISCIAFT